MTYQGDFTLPTELLEQIATSGFDKIPELIRIVVVALPCKLNVSSISVAHSTNVHLNRMIRLTAISQNGQTRLGGSPLMYLKCARVASPEALRKVCAVNEPSTMTLADVHSGCFHSQGNCGSRTTVRYIGIIYPGEQCNRFAGRDPGGLAPPAIERVSLSLSRCQV